MLDISQTKILARIAVLASLGRRKDLHRALVRARRSGIGRAKLVETLLQIHLFAGFPASIEAFTLFRSVFGQSKRISGRPMSLQRRKNLGTLTCRKVYRAKFSSLISSMKKLHPDLSDWMIQDGYGKVLSRNGLRLVERELISVAILAALGWERQLRSHVIGSVNVGSTARDVTAVLRSISSAVSGKRFERALLVAERALEKKP